MGAEPALHTSPSDGSDTPPTRPTAGLRFWGTFVCLCMLAFVSALDVAVNTTSLPTVTENIGGARQYV